MAELTQLQSKKAGPPDLIQLQVRYSDNFADGLTKLPNGGWARVVPLAQGRPIFGGQERNWEQLEHYFATGVMPERDQRPVSGERKDGDIWREGCQIRRRISGKTTIVQTCTDEGTAEALMQIMKSTSA